MKRMIGVICILFAGQAFANDNCTETVLDIDTSPYHQKRKLTLACITAAGGAMTAYDIVSTALDGFYIYTVTSFPGGTAPTDLSDFTLTATNGNKSLEIMGTNGTDFIDATTTIETATYNTDLSINFPHLWDDANTYSVDIDNNAVDNATFSVEFMGVRQ